MATKNAWASESWPAIPTRIESPIAAMIADTNYLIDIFA